MERTPGNANDLQAAVRHILAESLGEDDAALVFVPVPVRQAPDADGCNWTMTADEPIDAHVQAAVLEAQRTWLLVE